MYKVITAIGNEKINYKLKDNNKLEIKYDDIQYEEGIIEIIKKEEKINYLIINYELIEDKLKNFIKNIKKNNNEINIILIIKEELLEKDLSIEKEVKIIKINNNIEANNNINKLVERIEACIFKTNIIEEKIDIIKKENNKVIIFVGSSGVGKTTIINKISKIMGKKYKILIIDLNIKNKDIKTLFRIKENLKEKIIKKINNNISVIADINKLNNINNNQRINKKKYLEIILNKIKEKYDYIFIDTDDNFFDNDSFIDCFFMNNSNEVFLLIIPDLIGIKRTKKIIRKMPENNNIKYIINKKDNNSVNKKIVEKIIKKKIKIEINYFNKFKDEKELEKIIKIIEKGE